MIASDEAPAMKQKLKVKVSFDGSNKGVHTDEAPTKEERHNIT